MKTRIGALLVLVGVGWGCGGAGPTGIPIQDPQVTPAVTVAVTPRPTAPVAIQSTPTPCRPQKYCHGR